MNRTALPTRKSSRRVLSPRHVRSPRQHTPASIAQIMEGSDSAIADARPEAAVRPVRGTRHRLPMGWGRVALAMLGLGAMHDAAG